MIFQKKLRNKANLIFICKNPGDTDAEMEAAENRAKTVVYEFVAKFPDRLTQQAEIRLTRGARVKITMQVFFKDSKDLMKMKEYGDKLVIENGLSDLAE